MVGSVNPNFISEVNKLLSSLESKRNQLSIIIVANVKDLTSTTDYKKHSVTTDFFSVDELEQIIAGFRDAGFYTQIFTDELDFMKSVSTDAFLSIPGERKIIYNTAQKGVGAARHSLIPAFCKANHIPYIGSNAYVSCLCRHKYHFNRLLSRYHNHLPQAWHFDHALGWLLGERPPEGLKVIAKPVYEAASIGISEESVFEYTTDKDNWLLDHSQEFQQPFTIEEFIDGYEVEVPILIPRITYGLGPVGISFGGQKKLGEKILSYDEVYDDRYGFYDFQEVNEETIADILSCATDSSTILGIEDFGRIDFRVKTNGNFYLTDITTGPHITKHSSCNYAFNKHGFSHSSLLATIVACGLRRYS